MSDRYKTGSEIEEVVRGFESCTTAKDEFTHRKHLTVAVFYLQSSTLDQTIEKMRAGLFRFLDHHAVSREKYNETLTIFWIRLVQSVLDELDPSLSLLEITNAVLQTLSDSRLVFDYYSHERLWSGKAKEQWTDPDLRSIDS